MERKAGKADRYHHTQASTPGAGLPATCRLIHEVSPGEMPPLLPTRPVHAAVPRAAASWGTILRRLFGRHPQGRHGLDAPS